MSNSINEAFGNVSLAMDNVKSNLATAITSKGVQTNNTDTFAKMTENIGKITSGGSNGKKYGVGDFIEGNAIETHKLVQKEWEKVANINNGVCCLGADLTVIDDSDLVVINTNTLEEKIRISGFQSNSSVIRDGGYLYILVGNELKKYNTNGYTLVKRKEYDNYYSDILIDKDYIYLIGSDIRATRVNKTTLNDEKATGEIDYSFSNDKSLECVELTDKYLYISYMYEGTPSVVKITKSSFDKNVKRVNHGLIKSMLWDKERYHLYTFQSGKLNRYSEDLEYYKEILSGVLPFAQKMFILNNKIVLNYNDIFIHVDKYDYEVLFRIVLGTDKRSFYFPSVHTKKYFSVKYENGVSKIQMFSVLNEYKHKVLR